MERKAGDIVQFAEISGGEPIVSMVTYKDRVLIATANNVWVVKDGAVEPMKLEWRGPDGE